MSDKSPLVVVTGHPVEIILGVDWISQVTPVTLHRAGKGVKVASLTLPNFQPTLGDCSVIGTRNLREGCSFSTVSAGSAITAVLDQSRLPGEAADVLGR